MKRARTRCRRSSSGSRCVCSGSRSTSIVPISCSTRRTVVRSRSRPRSPVARTRPRASPARSLSGVVRALNSNRSSRSRPSGRTSKAKGASLDAKVSYPAGSVGAGGEHRLGEGRSAQAAAVALDDAAEGMHRGAVRIQRGGVSGGVDRRDREGEHAVVACRVGGSGVLRLPRRRSVPIADRRLAGRWCQGRSDRRDVHQQSRDHLQHVQDRPRRPRQHVRAVPPGGQVLGAWRRTGISARAS